MKAALRSNMKIVECVDISAPELSENDVLVKVDTVGICGSDINRVAEDLQKWNSVVLGHEFSGTVVKTGKEVHTVVAGERVSAAPLMPCHICDQCKQGLFSLCKNYSFIGSRVHGSMAEYVSVPEANIIRIPDDLSFEEAAFLEPVTVCLHPIITLGNLLGKDVLISGAGAIGLIALQIFKTMGARNVIVTDVVQHKLDIARTLGADCVINATSDNVAVSLCDHLGYNTVDLVFESSGSSAAKKAAVTVAKGKGIILQVGTSPFDITYEGHLYEQITRKELEIRGSWMNYSAPFPGSEWKIAIWLLQSGYIKIEKLITHRYSLSDIGKAYDMIFANNEHFIKVLIKP
jgi:L-iditol 2-dehydrogenase